MLTFARITIMKKFLAVVAVLALSACGCMSYNEEEPEVTYQNVQTRPENCDYFDGKTCYRYIRRVHQAPAVRYREPRQIEVIPEGPSCGCQHKASASCGCQRYAAPAPVAMPAQPCGGCAPQVSTTREPVEVLYKKTTYTTVYEPRTSAAVSYERVPYAGQSDPAVMVPLNGTEQVVIENK